MKNVIVSGPFGNVTENVNALYNYDACNITSVTIITYLVNIILIESVIVIPKEWKDNYITSLFKVNRMPFWVVIIVVWHF